MVTEHWGELVITDHPKKMSETLADYARPLTDQLPADHTLEELKATIVFAAGLWSTVDVQGIRDAVVYLSTKMPPRLRVPAPRGLAIIRRMLTRKDESFGDDHRLALDVDVVREGDEIRIKAIGVGPNPDLWDPKSKA
jgi:hypothetical protein